MAGGEGEGEERGLFLTSQETAQLITYEGQITDSKLSTAERNKIPMWTIKASTWWKGQRFLIQQAAGHGPKRAGMDARLSGQPGGGQAGVDFWGLLPSKSSGRFWCWQAVLWALFSSHALLTAEPLATNLSDVWDGEESGRGGRRRAKALQAIRYLLQDAAGRTEKSQDDGNLPSLFFFHYLFFKKRVDFPDVGAQIPAPGISNSLWSVVRDPLWSLKKIAVLESGMSYPLYPFHPPCQPSPQSALGCKDLKVKADGLAKGRAKG